MNELYDLGLSDNGKGLLVSKRSPIHGLGLFTSGDLPAGTIICRRLGLRSNLSPRDKRAIIGTDGLDPAEADDVIFKHINHSCQPNACLTDTGCLINFQQVNEGSEITIDYASLLTGSDWQIPCNCNTQDCRGIIQSLMNHKVNNS